MNNQFPYKVTQDIVLLINKQYLNEMLRQQLSVKVSLVSFFVLSSYLINNLRKNRNEQQ